MLFKVNNLRPKWIVEHAFIFSVALTVNQSESSIYLSARLSQYLRLIFIRLIDWSQRR